MHTIESADVVNLFKFATHLSNWYLSQKSDAGLDRLMQATLRATLSALGLLTDESQEPTRSFNVTAGPVRATPADCSVRPMPAEAKY